jgi:hypothetical protein
METTRPRMTPKRIDDEELPGMRTVLGVCRIVVSGTD